MSPFDPKSVLLAKHAQHVVLIHFPIALFMAGVAFDVVAARTKNAVLVVAAYYNLMIAAILAIPVLLTGLLAWRWALEGSALKGILLWHLLSAITVSVLMGIVARVHFLSHRSQQPLPPSRIPIEAFTVLLLGFTAHLGGFLSGVSGT